MWLTQLSISLLLILMPWQISQAEVIQKLPQPNYKDSKPLMQVLRERHSSREFNTKKNIDMQTLGDILWAAWGVNRPSGEHTIPTSKNSQDLQIYVIKADGAWLYDSTKHILQQVTNQDLRSLLAKQKYVLDAPISLVYTGRKNAATMHAGSSYQNVGLYCASKGLNNVVRSYIAKSALAKALNLDKKQKVLVSQTIGWPPAK